GLEVITHGLAEVAAGGARVAAQGVGLVIARVAGDGLVIVGHGSPHVLQLEIGAAAPRENDRFAVAVAQGLRVVAHGLGPVALGVIDFAAVEVLFAVIGPHLDHAVEIGQGLV